MAFTLAGRLVSIAETPSGLPQPYAYLSVYPHLYVTGVTVANPGVVATQVAHGLSSGQTVTVAGVLGATQVNVTAVATVVDATHFSLPVNVTGTYLSGGSVTRLSGAGLATVYTDRTKTTTASNPIQADLYGNYTCYAAPGDYDFVLNGGLVTQTVLPDTADIEAVVGAEVTANKDAASGYAGLTAGVLLKSAEIPFGTTAGTVADGGAVATSLTTKQARWNPRVVATIGGGSTYTLAAYDQLEADCTLGAATVNPPASPAVGDEIDMKKMDTSANLATFIGTVDGVANPALTLQYQTMSARWDGAKWTRPHRTLISNLVDYPATTDARYARPMGVWSNATAYLVDAVVTRSGGTYRALVNNTNVDPVGNPATWEPWLNPSAFDASGTSANDVTAHVAAADPHGDRAFAIQRANHTGTQAESTVTNLTSDLSTLTTNIAANTTAIALRALITETTDVVTLTAGGTQAIPDVTADTIHAYTFGAGNVTFTFPAAARGKSFTLALTQDGTGSRTATWPSTATVRWSGGTTPVLTTTAAKTDYLSFVCTDGTHWDGFTSGLNF